MFEGFRPRRAPKPPFCQHPLWSRSQDRARRLSNSQLEAWGTAISGHAMRILEQGAAGPEDADEVVLAGLSLMAIGMEQQRRAERD